MKGFRCFLLLLTISVFISCGKKVSENTLKLHNKKVLILGNSITQYGKYVDFLEYYLRKNYPKETLDIISIGLSSETVSGDSEKEHPFKRPHLHSRLKSALLKVQPDLVISCYGINDGIYAQKDSTRFNNYKTGIINLIKAVENSGSELILLTPTPFDKDPIKAKLSKENESQSYKNPYYNYDAVLKDYSDWLKSLNDIKVIDLHQYLNNELNIIKKIKTDSTFILDGIHPNTTGHFFMAKKIIKELYPKIVLKDAVSEIHQLKKDTLFKVITKRRKIRSKGWLDYIGYTRKIKVKTDNIEQTKEKVKELNSYITALLNK
ncbi:hypothetical protein BW723_05020 [Polaribacter reichenbachii]|uniref:SGNH hydrolase-type esterase domain-containing protein n=1 Tax=Polaribacter reichenbachii TaxID=996801 RepID=A0A1B8TU36_9FLAO|nr:SGNH/GDSL hydrolase family protein [Polaribacter reichenbachii]APZ45698.1 hypothetical protein BW723_05020 [Polaribacter reichenbachii]AUC19560.1 hypothetical protein BTO17_13030 [Polaribacter reichenbachii]OBY63286.1 hypothetical protein LPB301_10690 [Polaribacter reichenbachii]